MADRITDILAAVPALTRPATRNDASTIASLADGLEPRLVDWALTVATAAAAEVLRDVAPSRVEALSNVIGRSIEAISLNLVRYLLRGRDSATAVRVSRAQRQTAIDSVHLDIPLDRIVGGLRTLDHHWRRAFIEFVLERTPAADAVGLLTGVDRSLSIYFGTLIDENSRIYLDERQRIVEERVTGQRQLLGRVAAGQAVEESALADAFGMQPGDSVRMLVVRGAAHASGPDFSAYRRSVERGFRDQTLTSIPADGASVWLLLAGPPLADDEVTARLRTIGDETPGAAVASGLAGTGVAGLHRAQHTALAAAALQRSSASLGPVVTFGEHGMLALLAQRTDLARWFVEHELGPLLADPGTAELQRTLRVLLGCSGSLTRTAETLYVHRNTVAYRLKRIEEILERDPLARPIETSAALLLAEQQIAALVDAADREARFIRQRQQVAETAAGTITSGSAPTSPAPRGR